jgi:hypothetical protein
MSLIDPRQTVMLESGYGLDAIGALRGVDLPREAGETDHAYRSRLSVRLWGWAGSTKIGNIDAPRTGD